MKEKSFRVSCPSCETLFEVTDPELIGQIVACPKCGGMMMIEPPAEHVEQSVGDETTTDFSPEKGVVPTGDEADDRSVAVSASLLDSDVNEKEGDEDEPEPPVRKLNVPLIVSGVICALIAVLGVGFIRAYRATPEVDVPVETLAPEDAAQPEATVGDAETDDETVALEGEDSSSFDVVGESGDDFGVVNVSDPSDADKDEGMILEETPDSWGAEIGAEAESEDDESESETASDEDDEIALPDTSDVFDETVGEEAIEDDSDSDAGSGTSDDGDENEDLSEDDAIPTEFDEAEFEKENQAEEEKDEPEEDLGAVASTTDVSQSSLPVLRGEPREIDVDSRMSLRIRSIVFPESPAAATRLLSEFSGVPIEFDLDRFVLLRPSLKMRLDLKLDDVDVNEALAREAEMLKWSVRKEKDRIVIEPKESELSEVVEQRFDVADLLADESPFLVNTSAGGSTSAPEKISPDSFLAFVKTLVSPENWGDGDGQGTLTLDGSTMVVAHNSSTRKEVEILLEQLRVLRRLNTESDIATENLIPENLGWETLSRKTSFNLLKPVSLQQAIETLENKYKFLVLWDDAALNAAGVGRNSSTGAKFDSVPIEQVLSDLLEPFKLTFVILDEKLVLITTSERANSYKTVEIHGFSSLDSPKTFEEATKITEEMKKAVAPDSWDDPDVGLWLDVENACWISRQSQPVQREIRRWTNVLLEKERAKEKKESGKSTSPINGDSSPEVASRPDE